MWTAGAGRRACRVLACAVLAVAAGAPAGAQALQEARTVMIGLSDPQQNMARGFEFDVSIGGGPRHLVQLDTGSTGIVVSQTALGPEAVGPGRAGRIEYTSDGKIFEGAYYLATVALFAGAGSAGPLAETVPIEVLAVDRQACDPHYPECTVDQDLAHVGVFGVGFDRDTGSPSVNPVLQLTAVHADVMHAGYIVSATGVTIGITPDNTQGFRVIQLNPSPRTPGDWLAAPGCYAFPAVAGASAFCGTMLVDTGISGMILRAPELRRPPALMVPSSNALPSGTEVQIAAPSVFAPVLSYAFTYQPSPSPVPAFAPTALRWSSAGDTIFLNTGRDVLMRYDYLYDAAGGRIGFRPRG